MNAKERERIVRAVAGSSMETNSERKAIRRALCLAIPDDSVVVKRKNLLAIEWPRGDGDFEPVNCVACGGWFERVRPITGNKGHQPNCWLAAALGDA